MEYKAAALRIEISKPFSLAVSLIKTAFQVADKQTKIFTLAGEHCSGEMVPEARLKLP